MAMLYAPICLLLAVSVFAQTQEVFLARANQDPDHKWTDSINSNRFTVWYSKNAGDCAGLTEQQAQTALNELEKSYDVYVNQSKFQPPYSATTPANQKYKMGVYVLRNGSNCTNAPNSTCGNGKCCNGTTTCDEGYAFGGTIGNPLAPGMWLSSNAVGDKWALSHEFMHGLQIMTGGMSGGSTNQGTNFTGWFYESHANWMPHQVYPNEVHYCAEMYTRTAQLYLGSTRNRYCNWQFFEYIMDKKGIQAVNDIWSKSKGVEPTDPFSEIMRQNSISQQEFGDIFGDFATKAVIWDLNRGSVLFRAAFNKNLGNPDEKYKRPRYTYLEALDGENATDNRYVSPFAFAPQRYGFNVIRLYPDSSRSVKVRFRGDVQTKNNIPSYAKTLNLEPAATHLPNDPGSDWRYGLVAVTGDATAVGGTVTARYSEIKRASDGNPDVSMQLQNGETQVYLVVAATPTIHHRISWDQFYYTVYRFPYMVEITGAKPEGFQALTNPAGKQHSNGGGFVQSTATVDATAYVGPNARVLGTARVRNNARIEGRAVVKGNAQVYGNAVVKDYALVAGGQVYGSAVVAEGANIWNAQVYENARIDGAPNISHANAKIYGSARVGGVGWIDQALDLSGTAQLLGDGEIYNITAVKGVFYGLVDAGAISSNQHGANRTEPPIEVTAPRSMKWYGDDEPPEPPEEPPEPPEEPPEPPEEPIEPPEEPPVKSYDIAHHKGAKNFVLNNRGIFSYNLGNHTFAQLKIFDIRGKLLKTVELHGTQGTVDIQLNSAQVIFWRVVFPPKKSFP